MASRLTDDDDGQRRVVDDHGHVYRVVGRDVSVWLGGEHTPVGDAGAGGRAATDRERQETQYTGAWTAKQAKALNEGKDPFRLYDITQFSGAWGTDEDVNRRWRQRVGLDPLTAGTI